MSAFSLQEFSSRLNEPDLEAVIVQIASEVAPGQVVKPDIEDDQKRWLIVGICLHSIISPALRQYIPPVVSKLYSSLKRTDQIDKQTYAKHLKRYKSTNRELNYEAINNNSALPKVKRNKDVQNYNYNVTNDVDLTKLFMLTSMANYTGFDDTCDSSALLGIIINIDTFPPLPKQVAEKVRSDIRNPWAHCNFSEWDVIKYQYSFQLMYQFIRNLLLPVKDETAILGKLTHWQTNGVQFLQGTTLGVELVQELKEETRALSKYILDIVSQTDASFKDVHSAILSIEGSLNGTTERINNLQKDSLEMKYDLNALTATVNDIQDGNEQISESVDKMKTDMKNVQSDVSKTRLELAENVKQLNCLDSESDSTKTEVKDLKTELKDTRENIKCYKLDLQDTKADVARNRADIDEMTRYLSPVRPKGKVFFYPPDRISTFMSREDELEQLKEGFQKRSNDHNIQVICGLGGIGKTTLSVEYAWTFQSLYPGGVFWMSAETNEALENSVQTLAIDTNTVGKNAKETLAMTLKWMSSVQNPWLLVIDNVDMDETRGSIKELILGAWKRNSKGHIIITSRRVAKEAEEEFHVRIEDCITLDVLNEYESIQFMKMRSGCRNDKNDESLNSLIKELGGLPLALEQAAAHVKALGCTFSEYLVKFNRKRLNVLKACRHGEMSKERQAVQTTWQLNFDYIEKHSEEEGLGCAAVRVMEIAAFLYADEIPLNIFNDGSPEIGDEDLIETFKEEVGVKQVAEILARFSLFKRCGGAISVHRLVQEVIRENLTDIDQRSFILQCATRMINKALKRTLSPRDALKEENICRTSLQMWSKLALSANTLKSYLFDFTKTYKTHMDICINIETAMLLQTSAIYHSLFQRQDEALACQTQMLSIIPALGISESDFRDLTCIKIPLLKNNRSIIQSSIAMATSTKTEPLVETDEASAALLDPESLRKMGNDAFKLQRYQDAIQCYSEAITASQGNVDPKILSNRSLAFLRNTDYENALRDADLCLQKDPTAYKAYCWKAYAIANLIRLDVLPKSWESAGLAAAAVAGYLNNQCLLEYTMKIEYPVVRFKIIENKSDLGMEMASKMNMNNTTLLLRRGCYQIALEKGEFATTSVQIIGIEEGVEIHSSLGVSLINPSQFFSLFQFEPEINVYFENVTFPNETGQIVVGGHVKAIFYRCKFSNGLKGCENYPFCKGMDGCVNPDAGECRVLSAMQEKASCPHPSGMVGSPGICSIDGGNALIDKCILDRCGGGGTLSVGRSVLKIEHSIVRNMRQMGVEAREGGFTIAENCTICDNQFHGVAIGPKGRGLIRNCVIQNNKNEGIWCGGNLDTKGKSRLTKTTNSEGGSTCTIFDNLIYQNGMSGISLDGGSYDVSGNRIFENWLWGMMVKSRSTTNICNNDIFENKCGGIRIGVNYSATVMMDANTIRDHTGPAVHTENVPEIKELPRSLHGTKRQLEAMKDIGMMDDEITFFSKPPIITTRNMFEKNNRVQQHPRQFLDLLETCCFCHIYSNSLKKCGKCKKASYCSKECQKQHWKRHKIICKSMIKNFTVDIKMSETTPWDKFFAKREGHVIIRGKNAPLPGLGEGQPPQRSSERKFIVKIQSGTEYTRNDPNKDLRLHDQTQTLDIFFKNPDVCHLVFECGVLAATKFTVKKIFCWASFKDYGNIVCIHTDNLPPFQTW